MSVVVANMVEEGVQGMQYSTVTLLDNLDRRMHLEMHHNLAGQPEAVRMKMQTELCCCKLQPYVHTHVCQPVVQLKP